MSDKCKVSIVITVFENFEESLLCLDSLGKCNDHNFETILVLNSIFEERQIEQYHRSPINLRLRIFQQSNNTGAALGRNIGASYARGEYILFLDSDNVVSPNLISHLSEQLDNNSNLGLVGPLMLHYGTPSLIWLAGANISDWTCLASYDDYLADRSELQDLSRNTGHIPNCFMIRGHDFRKIGGFREIYFIMYEEADLASRIKKELNMTISLTFECQTYHMVELPTKRALHHRIKSIGLSSPVRAFLTTRNRMIYARHNFSFFKALECHLVSIPMVTFVYISSCLLMRNFRGASATTKGFISGIIYAVFSVSLFNPFHQTSIVDNISTER